MVAYFLTPPGLYILIAFIIIISVIVYWKREPIKRELRRWRGKEVTVGPVKFERQNQENQVDSNTPKTGVDFGQENDFSGAKIKNVAGRDIRTGESKSSRTGATPGVDFGEKSKFKNTEIEDIAGRDLENKE